MYIYFVSWSTDLGIGAATLEPFISADVTISESGDEGPATSTPKQGNPPARAQQQLLQPPQLSYARRSREEQHEQEQREKEGHHAKR
jgi:hypothetical protein